MKRNEKLQIAAVVIAIASGVLAVKCHAVQGWHELKNFDGAGYSEDLPYRGQKITTEFLDNRNRMGEAVKSMGLNMRDQEAIVDHVIQDNGRMTIDQLRESNMSDEGFNQYMDDARTW